LIETAEMKILSVITYYYPHWTGLTAYAVRMAEGLAQRGHQVTVLTSRYLPELPATDVRNAVRIIRLPTLMRLSRGVIMPGFVGAANRLVKENDVIQVHTPMLEANLVTRLGLWHGKKTILTHHGDLVMPKKPFDQIIERVMTVLMTQAEREAAHITVHSCDYGQNSKFLSPFWNKLDGIYPPVEIPVPDSEGMASWRARLGLHSGHLVGFAGRFVEEKGFDYLLKAIPLVVKEFPEVKFVYAGERPVYEDFFERWKSLMDQERPHLVELGLIRDQQELANFYGMCDVFALPSRSDCFPSVQIEAMLCGTPVVCTDIPGAREVVRVTGMGKLVAPRDERALAAGIIELLRDPGRYRRSRGEIRQVFNTERSLDAYEKLFASQASRK
jgi:glycosyltransferase involved in cell wall biosynthesis